MKHLIRKILLVEDNKSFGFILKARLEAEFRLKVTWTQTLQQTDEILSTETEPFSMALLDYTLPDAPDGEVIDLVTGHGITSLVFTGNLNEEVREKVWSKKVADYILKNDPNSFEYIISTLKRLTLNSRSKVMVVEDSALFRKLFSDLLYVHQFQVLTAENGEKALELLQKHPEIKLIIVDYHMPVMDGHTLCRKVREQYKKEELAIIGISASNDHNMAARFLKSGANDFLMKESFLIEEFYCRINQCIDNVNLVQEIREFAARDFLTGLYNRRYFFENGAEQFKRSLDEKVPLTCAMIDIDFFKKVNDTYGHDIGDLVIQQISAIIKELMPESAIVSRFGGEEFCVLAFDMDKKTAWESFTTLCRTIEQSQVYCGKKKNLRVTVSIGICTEYCENLSKMVGMADQRLYTAKNQGRNMVIM